MDALPDLLSGKIVIEEGLCSALLLSRRGDGEQSDLLEDHDDVVILKQNRNLGRNQLRLSARRDVHGIAGGQASPRVFLQLPVYADPIRLEHLTQRRTRGIRKHRLQVIQQLGLRADCCAHRRKFSHWFVQTGAGKQGPLQYPSWNTRLSATSCRRSR